MSVRLGIEEPRRRRVYYADWKFKIGQRVNSMELAAIVLTRHRTAQGRELYQVWVTGESYGRPNRWILGSALIEEQKKADMMPALILHMDY